MSVRRRPLSARALCEQEGDRQLRSAVGMRLSCMNAVMAFAVSDERTQSERPIKAQKDD